MLAVGGGVEKRQGWEQRHGGKGEVGKCEE